MGFNLRLFPNIFKDNDQRLDDLTIMKNNFLNQLFEISANMYKSLSSFLEAPWLCNLRWTWASMTFLNILRVSSFLVLEGRQRVIWVFNKDFRISWLTKNFVKFCMSYARDKSATLEVRRNLSLLIPPFTTRHKSGKRTYGLFSFDFLSFIILESLLKPNTQDY